jgi:hypothetical protein
MIQSILVHYTNGSPAPTTISIPANDRTDDSRSRGPHHQVDHDR